MSEPDWTRPPELAWAPPERLPGSYRPRVREHGRIVQLIVIFAALALILGIAIASLV